MLGVVDGSVEIEGQFGHYAYLFADLASEFSAESAVLVLEREHHLRLFPGGEDAHVNLGNRKVRADAHFAHGHHGSAEGCHSLPSDNLREVFLYFTGNLELPC